MIGTLTGTHDLDPELQARLAEFVDQGTAIVMEVSHRALELQRGGHPFDVVFTNLVRSSRSAGELLRASRLFQPDLSDAAVVVSTTRTVGVDGRRSDSDHRVQRAVSNVEV